jgi:hypothetical protein
LRSVKKFECGCARPSIGLIFAYNGRRHINSEIKESEKFVYQKHIRREAENKATWKLVRPHKFDAAETGRGWDEEAFASKCVGEKEAQREGGRARGREEKNKCPCMNRRERVADLWWGVFSFGESFSRLRAHDPAKSAM